MILFGRHTYYEAHEVKPGNVYVASRGDDLQLVLGISSLHDGDSAGVLILKRLSGTAFSSDFVAVTGDKFAYQSQFMLIRDCLFVPGQSAEQWKLTPQERAPLGSLFSRNGSMFLVARSSSDSHLLINCENGEISGASMSKFFWTQDWTIMQKNVNDEWEPIFSR